MSCQFWLFYILITAHHVKNTFQTIKHKVQNDTTCKYWIPPSQCSVGSCAALNLHGCGFRIFLPCELRILTPKISCNIILSYILSLQH